MLIVKFRFLKMISSFQNQDFSVSGNLGQKGRLLACRFPGGFSIFRPLSSGHRLQSPESVHVVCEIPETDLNFSPGSSYTSYL
jgi:hypothetical protein